MSTSPRMRKDTADRLAAELFAAVDGDDRCPVCLALDPLDGIVRGDCRPLMLAVVCTACGTEFDIHYRDENAPAPRVTAIHRH